MSSPIESLQPDEIPARRHYDAIVIGSGSGGLTVAVGLGRFGRQVLLVERRHMGGDCTNTGCVPSKSLLHNARGLGSGRTNSSPGAVLNHVRSRRDQLRDHEVEEYGSAEGVTFVYGSGRLSSAQQVVITTADGTVWSAGADNVILATGSSARRIPIEGLPESRYLTNHELFEIAEPPNHLVVIGGGAVGLEMALAFRHLGSKVSVIEAADSILANVMPQASSIIAEELQGHDIDFHTSLVARRYDRNAETLFLGPALQHDSADDDPDLERQLAGVDRVLVAVGRVPRTSELGLDELGIAKDHHGAVIVDGRGRTSVDHVWAVGDMTDRGGTTHFATIWGRRIIQSIVYPRFLIGDEPLRPTVVFTEPEVAVIGHQPDVAPDGVVRITVDGTEIDRSFTDEIGHSILIVDVRAPTGEVVGATVVSPRAGEIISTFSLAMKTGIGFHRWYGTVIPYPSYAELITVAVERYLAELSADAPGHVRRWMNALGRRFGRYVFRPVRLGRGRR